MQRTNLWKLPLILAILALLVFAAWRVGQGFAPPSKVVEAVFSGQNALKDVEYQMALGPRIPGSEAHTQIIDWMRTELTQDGWSVEIQNSEMMGHPVANVVAKRGQGTPWVILGAHYDSRLWADQDTDPQLQHTPVPGADDGASGVAILMELARSLPKDLHKQVWLAFFDVEDNGEIPGWDWLLGSKAFVDNLKGKPDAVVVIDMVGDANLNIYKERNSNSTLTDEIWNQAAKLGYADQFIPVYKYSMLDDHTPFLQAGIPAIDIIDFDYPYWHTTADTTDKVSAGSMQVVGDTLWAWLTQTQP